jgi:cell shape-determining protein MreC
LPTVKEKQQAYKEIAEKLEQLEHLKHEIQVLQAQKKEYEKKHKASQ